MPPLSPPSDFSSSSCKASITSSNGTTQSEPGNRIAQALGVDDKTVATVRAGLIATSEIPKLEKLVGVDGKERPVRRLGGGHRKQAVRDDDRDNPVRDDDWDNPVKGVIIPDEAKANSAAMSAWIDSNRGKKRRKRGRKTAHKSMGSIAPQSLSRRTFSIRRSGTSHITATRT
jgi:hypothetical protein